MCVRNEQRLYCCSRPIKLITHRKCASLFFFFFLNTMHWYLLISAHSLPHPPLALLFIFLVDSSHVPILHQAGRKEDEWGKKKKHSVKWKKETKKLELAAPVKELFWNREQLVGRCPKSNWAWLVCPPQLTYSRHWRLTQIWHHAQRGGAGWTQP